VVNTIQLVLWVQLSQLVCQLLRALQVVPKRLLNNDSNPGALHTPQVVAMLLQAVA
jgi:hypothetical protein